MGGAYRRGAKTSNGSPKNQTLSAIRGSGQNRVKIYAKLEVLAWPSRMLPRLLRYTILGHVMGLADTGAIQPILPVQEHVTPPDGADMREQGRIEVLLARIPGV
jgi:hypothetical protein